jgi:hypothetical protein
MGHTLGEMNPTWNDARQAEIAKLAKEGYEKVTITLGTSMLVCLGCGCFVRKRALHDRTCLHRSQFK